MKSVLRYAGFLAFFLQPSLGARIERRDCTPNNCIRELRAHGEIASSDCSSYLKHSTTTVTVTPGLGRTISETTTETVTNVVATVQTTITEAYTEFGEIIKGVVKTIVDSTLDPPLPATLARRAHKTVPAYASACTSDLYASACSCYGVFSHTKTVIAHSVKPSTVVVDTQTITAAATTTELNFAFSVTTIGPTVTHTATVTAEPGTFAVYVEGGALDSSYMVGVQDTTILEQRLVMPGTAIEATNPPDYYNVTDGNLYTYFIDDFSTPIYQSYYVGVGGPGNVVFEPISSQPDPRLVCGVSAGLLNCRASDGSTVFWGCVDPSGESPTAGLYLYPEGVTANVPTLNCYPVPAFAAHYVV